MGRTGSQIIAWLAQHASTRVGPRGRQVQVPVERIEAVTVRHYTSRAGDPHRHLHLQVNALDAHVAGKEPDDLVFGGIRKCQPLRVSTFRSAFSTAAASIGIPGLHPHELRHTAASLAIASGADVKVVQKMLATHRPR